jgi:hypothetical protein
MLLNRSVYVRFDADNIGDKLELLLIRGNISAASALQAKVQSAMNQLHAALRGQKEVEILFVGCDDILFKINVQVYNLQNIEKFRKFFEERSGCTLSGGVGINLEEALKNLRIAKLEGKNKIIEPVSFFRELEQRCRHSLQQ